MRIISNGIVCSRTKDNRSASQLTSGMTERILALTLPMTTSQSQLCLTQWGLVWAAKMWANGRLWLTAQRFKFRLHTAKPMIPNGSCPTPTGRSRSGRKKMIFIRARTSTWPQRPGPTRSSTTAKSSEEVSGFLENTTRLLKQLSILRLKSLIWQAV